MSEVPDGVPETGQDGALARARARFLVPTTEVQPSQRRHSVEPGRFDRTFGSLLLPLLEQDEPGAAPVGEVGLGPLEEDDDPVAESDEKHDVD